MGRVRFPLETASVAEQTMSPNGLDSEAVRSAAWNLLSCGRLQHLCPGRRGRASRGPGSGPRPPGMGNSLQGVHRDQHRSQVALHIVTAGGWELTQPPRPRTPPPGRFFGLRSPGLGRFTRARGPGSTLRDCLEVAPFPQTPRWPEIIFSSKSNVLQIASVLRHCVY